MVCTRASLNFNPTRLYRALLGNDGPIQELCWGHIHWDDAAHRSLPALDFLLLCIKRHLPDDGAAAENTAPAQPAWKPDSAFRRTFRVCCLDRSVISLFAGHCVHRIHLRLPAAPHAQHFREPCFSRDSLWAQCTCRGLRVIVSSFPCLYFGLNVCRSLMTNVLAKLTGHLNVLVPEDKQSTLLDYHTEVCCFLT